MKTFVDNVCRQVIERHLLRTLPDVANRPRFGCYSQVPTGPYWGLLMPTCDLSKYMVTYF
jgi:hypothetical protein